MRKICSGIFLSAILLINLEVIAQGQVLQKPHYLLGMDVQGYEIGLPFSKSEADLAWNTYSKSWGRSEATHGHKSYETVFVESVYGEKVLLFSEITGDAKSSKVWAGIDPQGIPKETYPKLQKEMADYVYGFYIKMRKDAAQKQIDDAERAASFLSKSYEELKREERKDLKNQEKNNQKIQQYEMELKQMRQDSVAYIKSLEVINVKLDSVYVEAEKVKKLVELYKAKLEEIE
ncbi:hypothetical protein C9994_07005 [Marivirga lumbricoides]|uniref:Uncharacterized protein n=1 Tax=Marivirga lumbricoides TaxID=1046115 RepID=A0A2T4DRU7_9BACT|nr:hypothetical protein C9994_07005 [Marivirga lumbricoides]